MSTLWYFPSGYYLHGIYIISPLRITKGWFPFTLQLLVFFIPIKSEISRNANNQTVSSTGLWVVWQVEHWPEDLRSLISTPLYALSGPSHSIFYIWFHDYSNKLDEEIVQSSIFCEKIGL